MSYNVTTGEWQSHVTIMSYFEIKQEPPDEETFDPIDVDPLSLSDLIKVEITENPVFSPGEEQSWPSWPLLLNPETESQDHVEPEPVTDTDQPAFILPSPSTGTRVTSSSTAPSSSPNITPGETRRSGQAISVIVRRPGPAVRQEERDVLFRKMKKVKLERERRVVMKQLFEDLDYWVGLEHSQVQGQRR